MAPQSVMQAAQSVLVLVDFQERLMPAIHDSVHVLGQAERLAHIANGLNVPVVGTEQVPSKLGRLPFALAQACDALLSKQAFSGCDDGLLEVLSELATAGQIVIAGCETHVCLLQTALGLLAEGYQVFVVADACGSRQQASKDLALHRLREAGAVIVNVEMVAFEWLGSAENEKFVGVHRLIK